MKHYFLPIDNVIYSYVVETEEKKISDFVSFYCLPSTIINHPKHNQLRAAYSYYHVSTATPLNTLINNALILAKKNNFDVFNALNLMENESFLQVNEILFLTIFEFLSCFFLLISFFFPFLSLRSYFSAQVTEIFTITFITGNFPKNSNLNNLEWYSSENR